MKKIAFVIDGYYGLTLYKHIKSAHGKVTNFEGLVNSTCEGLGKCANEKCIAPANLRHYFMGTDPNIINPERNEYENALRLARFGARGRPLQNGREKGIDTMLYSDIKSEADSGLFDYLVLFAGDLDHITLVQDLKDLGIKTVLIYGEIVTNGKKTTGYAEELKDSCFDSVDLFQLLENKEIFQSSQPYAKSMTNLMKGTVDGATGRAVVPVTPSVRMNCPARTNHSVQTRQTAVTVPQASTGSAPLLQRVIASVKQVITKNELIQGRTLVFALQAEVGKQLKRNGIVLPIPLSGYLASYPTVFRTGTHPRTQATTVSIRL